MSAHHIAASLGYANDGYIQQRFPELCRAIRRKIATKKKSRFAAMEEALKRAIHEEPVPSLSDLCRRLGCATSDTLRSHFPFLCNQIMARRRVIRGERIAKLRKTLHAALAESPAPSLTSLCRRVRLSRASLLEMCPDECAAIGSRYLRARKEASQSRKDQLVQEVRQIVNRLHRQSIRPTMARVVALLPATTLREWRALQIALDSAKQEIEQE